VLTNGESGSVAFNGTLYFPDQNVQAISGSYSFWHSDTGGNFSVGYDAGDYLSSGGGGGNTAVGYQAMTFNTAGPWNTALGSSALFLAGTGNANTAIGGNALGQLGGFQNAGGTNNIALGYLAGFNFTTNESYNIDIGNSGVSGENSTIRIGTPGVQTTAYIAGVVNDVGGVQVGSAGTTMSVIQSGQAIVAGSSTQETNYTIAFPHPFSSSPKIIFTLANDPGFQGVSDVFASSVSSNSPAAFSINVYRLNGTSWSQQLRVNWQAWQ